MHFPTWLGGVGVSLFASTLSSTGLVMQKYSHRLYGGALGDPAKRPPCYRQKWWVVGMIVFLVAQLLNTVAMALTPQVVVSCLGSWSLVCNAIFAHCFLGEHLLRWDWLSIFGLCISQVLVVCGTPVSQDHSMVGNVHMLCAAFKHTAFILGSINLFVLLVVFAVLVTLWRRHQARKLGIEARPASARWAVAAAVMSGYTALLFRCCALMVFKAPPGEPSPWQHSEAYAILLGALLCGLLQIRFLNYGLRAGDAVVVVPIFFSLGMLAQMFTGAIFFKELRNIGSHPAQVPTFATGTGLSMVCVAALTLVHAMQKPSATSTDDGSIPLVDLPPQHKVSPALVLAKASSLMRTLSEEELPPQSAPAADLP